MEEFVPHWQNHIMHTLPLATAIVESFINKHEYNKSFAKGCGTPILFGLLYLAW